MRERLAVLADLDRLIEIRGSVKENQLDDPSRITSADYCWYIEQRLLWVVGEHEAILGFSASDSRDGSIWAVFVDPAHEGRGVGKRPLARAVAGLAAAGYATAKLRTGDGTRAERFYRANGWRRVGTDARGEALMERVIEPG